MRGENTLTNKQKQVVRRMVMGDDLFSRELPKMTQGDMDTLTNAGYAVEQQIMEDEDGFPFATRFMPKNKQEFDHKARLEGLVK